MSESAHGHVTSVVDRAWFRMGSPDNHMVVTAVMVLDGPLDRTRFRQVLMRRLLPLDRFRQVMTPSSLPLLPHRWRDDDEFDLEAHVHHVALPHPGGDDELAALVGDIMGAPLDPDRPLWSMTLVDGYGAGSAVVARLHHCIADGVALARVMLSLTDEGPEELVETIPAPVGGAGGLDEDGEPRPGVAGTAWRIATGALRESAAVARSPRRGLRDARGVAAGVRALLRVSLIPPDPVGPLKGELGRVKAVCWTDPIALDEVRATAHGLGATVNDVLMSTVAGALRRHLLAAGTEVDGVEVHVTVPVNLRALDGPTSLGNRFGLVYPAMPVGIADPVERLAAVRRNMNAIKATPEALVSLGFIGLMGLMPARAERYFNDYFTSRSTAVVTNVPTPRRARWLAGTRITRLIVWAPPSGSLGLSVTIISYAGEITVGFATDTRLVPHPGDLAGGIAPELEALRAAAGVGAGGRAAATAAKPPVRGRRAAAAAAAAPATRRRSAPAGRDAAAAPRGRSGRRTAAPS